MLMVQKLNVSKFLKHENKITASSDKWNFLRIFSWSIAMRRRFMLELSARIWCVQINCLLVFLSLFHWLFLICRPHTKNTFSYLLFYFLQFSSCRQRFGALKCLFSYVVLEASKQARDMKAIWIKFCVHHSRFCANCAWLISSISAWFFLWDVFLIPFLKFPVTKLRKIFQSLSTCF